LVCGFLGVFILLDGAVFRLNQIIERKGLDGHDRCVSWCAVVSVLGQQRGSLQVHFHASLGCLSLGQLVAHFPCQDLLLALALPNMLNPHMNSLLDDTAIHELVHSDSNGGLGEVKDNSGTPMVVLVWHALVDGRVAENINVISDLQSHEVLGHVDKTVLTELLRKHLARARPFTERMRHI
tara:strand:- start:61 stop:603 length:543 start_codon:yes stop_codon:yes gene_type:complete